MINLKTKNEGMTYLKNGREYRIHHGYFRVIDLAEIPNDNRIKIHVQNREYDQLITPFIDKAESISKGSIIKMAYIVEDQGIVCHGYEVTNEPRPELDYGNLPPHKNLILEDQLVDVNKYKAILVRCINTIKSDQIRLFVNNILMKKSDRFYTWPAASNVHHNIKSGLLLHTVNVAKTAYNIASNYTDIDLDLVLAGAILHDIGKIYEYSEDGSISGEGNLFDHINIGTRIIFEEYYHGEDQPYSFSERDLYSIAHIILSHHGKLEWGSSRTPATKEAMVVHYADYIDTNMYIAHRDLQNVDIDQSVKSRYAGQLVQTKLATSVQYDNN